MGAVIYHRYWIIVRFVQYARRELRLESTKEQHAVNTDDSLHEFRYCSNVMRREEDRCATLLVNGLEEVVEFGLGMHICTAGGFI